jgi:preprotein translocase subunit YajC
VDIASLLPFVLIVVVGYLLLVRPARARQREMALLQEQLVPGVEVMTTAGLYATVVALDEASVTLETAPGVSSRWDRRAVARVVTPLDAPADAPAYADDLDRGATGASGATAAPDDVADRVGRADRADRADLDKEGRGPGAA